MFLYIFGYWLERQERFYYSVAVLTLLFFFSWDVSGPNYGVLEDYEYQSTAEINQIQGGHSIQTHEYTGKKNYFIGPGNKTVKVSDYDVRKN